MIVFILPTHPLNALIMRPGGYKTIDYVKAGTGMTFIFAAVVLGMMYFVYGISWFCDNLGQPNGQHRDGGMHDHPFGGAADQDLADNALPVGSHDDEITVLFYRCLNYYFGGYSVFD